MRALGLCALLLLPCGCDTAAPDDAGARHDGGPRRDAGPAPDDSPNKGPWVRRPTERAVTVRRESVLEPGTLAVDVVPEGGSETRSFTGASRETVTQLSYGIGSPIVTRPDVPGTYVVNEVEVSGLDPATCYTYTIVGWPTSGGASARCTSAPTTRRPSAST